MTNVILTAAGFENPRVGAVFSSLVGHPRRSRVLFFPTAARTPQERAYVRASLQELRDVGCCDIREREMDHRFTAREFDGFDAVYVCGGNTYHLLRKMRECGFKTALDPFLKRGGLYVGVSAGSVVAGPTIATARDDNDAGLSDVSGLGLVPFAVMPHFTPEREIEARALRAVLPCPVVTLTDKQAMVVRDWEETLVG